MRQPRHVTPASLSAELPAEALARDEALLDQVQPGGPPLVRWYRVTRPAVVVGLGLWHRRAAVIDLERCRSAGVAVLDRRAGGGAVLLDTYMLCAAVCVSVPDARLTADLTESYRWLGERFSQALQHLGVHDAQRVEVDSARADVSALTARTDPLGAVLRTTCYGALSPYEVAVQRSGAAPRKIVGLAQVRRRHAALFQIGILLRDQSPLADLLRVPDEPTRAALRTALRQRTIGLGEALGQPIDTPAAHAALHGALDL